LVIAHDSELSSIRQRIRPKLDVLDITHSGLRKLRHVRTVRSPDTAALPAGSRIINAPIDSACKERHGIGQAKDRKLFRLRIEDQQGVRSCAGDNDRVLAKAERIELVYPQEVRVLGAAGFCAGACEFRSGQIPVAEFAGFRIQLCEMAAPGGEPEGAVGAEIDSVSEAEGSRQRGVFELPGLRIQHEQLVLGPIDLRYRYPDRAVHGTDRGGVTTR